MRVDDCIASHILLPIMETKGTPLSKLAIEISYPKWQNHMNSKLEWEG